MAVVAPLIAGIVGGIGGGALALDLGIGAGLGAAVGGAVLGGAAGAATKEGGSTLSGLALGALGGAATGFGAESLVGGTVNSALGLGPSAASSASSATSGVGAAVGTAADTSAGASTGAGIATGAGVAAGDIGAISTAPVEPVLSSPLAAPSPATVATASAGSAAPAGPAAGGSAAVSPLQTATAPGADLLSSATPPSPASLGTGASPSKDTSTGTGTGTNINVGSGSGSGSGSGTGSSIMGTTTFDPMSGASLASIPAGSSIGPSAAAGAGAGSGMLGGVGSWLGSNASWLLPAGGLAFMAGQQLLGGGLYGQYPEAQQLASTAASQQAAGTTLANTYNTGAIPPGAQEAIDQASASAKATVRSNFASMGLSGSTEEATALSNVDRSAAGQTFQVQQGLVSTGLQELNMSNSLYTNLLQLQLQQDQALQNAISSFAGSLALTSAVSHK